MPTTISQLRNSGLGGCVERVLPADAVDGEPDTLPMPHRDELKKESESP
jgi:hypothetical protein